MYRCFGIYFLFFVSRDSEETSRDADEVISWAAGIDAVHRSTETGEFTFYAGNRATARQTAGPLESSLRRKQADHLLPKVIQEAQDFVLANLDLLRDNGAATKAKADKVPKEEYFTSRGFRWEFALSRGDFKPFVKEKSDEVEAAYQLWVFNGRPTDGESRVQEIKITPQRKSSLSLDSKSTAEDVLSQSVPSSPRKDSILRTLPDEDHDGSLPRPACQFGEKCYRKNQRHRKEFAHVGDWDYPVTNMSMATDLHVGDTYSLDFMLMTQCNTSRRGARRGLRRRELPPEVQEICAPHYELVIAFTAKVMQMLEQAEFLAAWQEADIQEQAQKDMDVLVSNLRVPLKAFLQLAVATRSFEKLDTLTALLGEKANTLQIGQAVEHLKLTGTIADLRDAFIMPVPHGAYDTLTKWELVRKLVFSHLLTARVCRISQEDSMRTLRQKHSLMKCQTLLQEVPDEDFRSRFLLAATEVLSEALTQAAEWANNWRVLYILKIAHTWGLTLEDTTALSTLLSTNLNASLNSTLQGMDRVLEILQFFSQCAAFHCGIGLPSIEPYYARIVIKFAREQAALWQVNATTDQSVIHSVRGAMHIRSLISTEAAFDKALFTHLQQRFQADVRQSLIEWVIAYCENLHLPLPEWVLTKDQVECLQGLQEAEKTNDPKAVIKAVVLAKQIKGGIDAHETLKLGYTQALTKLKQLNRMPSGWDIEDMVKDENKPMYLKTELNSAIMLELVQSLFNETYLKVVTRDRDGGICKRFQVNRIQAVQNADTWKDYLNRCDQIRDQCKQDNPVSAPISGSQWTQWSGKVAALPTLKKILETCTLPALDPSINEFFFLHGTNPVAADQIAQCHFNMSYASKTGLFGAGIYFAENSSKSDEYVKSDDTGNFPIMLVRVALGRVNYCAEKEPWKKPGRRALEDSCLHGGFHSVLGDRKRARNTYREFVVYDNEQCYPHLIVWYSRVNA